MATSLELYKVHNLDARRLNEVVSTPIVDVTITSPPYYDLKDYGSDNQIGYGQQYEDYLGDLRKVFGNVYACTKETGTLWVIIDTFRKNGEVTTLPFDFAAEIRKVGWKLQEIIIWQKDRTVPWAHKGQMRNLFEYILVFSKTNDYKFFIDEVRDATSLKKWWVKYPERYNPKGKTPTGIWQFEIPTQGSWGDGYIRHFCPLPEEMIAQILTLTTREGDVVLDPFSGSGAVLAKADNMKRKYIGFELNSSYIKMFSKYLQKTTKTKRLEYESMVSKKIDQQKFQELIHNLRALKYAKVLYKKLNEKSISRILVLKSKEKPKKTNSLFVADYILYVPTIKAKVKIENRISELTAMPPLSKFGIQPIIKIITSQKLFNKIMDKTQLPLYSYTSKSTNRFTKKISSSLELDSLSPSQLIISPIGVNVTEEDHE